MIHFRRKIRNRDTTPTHIKHNDMVLLIPKVSQELGVDPYTILLVSRLSKRIKENHKHKIYKALFDAFNEADQNQDNKTFNPEARNFIIRWNDGWDHMF